MDWDGEFYHFKDPGVQDPDTPDELMLPPEALGEASKYSVDGLHLDLLLLTSEPVAVDLPESVAMRVKEAEMPKVGSASHYKTDPDLVYAALQRTGARSGESVMIGDTV